MQINEQYLKQNMLEYLRTPAGKAMLDDLDLPGCFKFGFQCLALVIGLFLLVTVVKWKLGLETLQKAFGPWSHKAKQNPELLDPLVLCGIIVGRGGHALVMGSFDPQTNRDYAFLARKANELGNLYINGSSDPRDAELFKTLREDAYIYGRRREVPASHAEGRNLVLFDVETQEALGGVVFQEAVFHLFAVCNEENAREIFQLPWNLTTAVPTRPLPVATPTNAPVRSAQSPGAAAAGAVVPEIVPEVLDKPDLTWLYVAGGVFAGLLLTAVLIGWSIAARPPEPPPAEPLTFNRWVFPADETGKSGYFENEGADWAEYKEGKLFARFYLSARTPEYVELKRTKRNLWVRLTPTEGSWSFDREQWTLIGKGHPE